MTHLNFLGFIFNGVFKWSLMSLCRVCSIPVSVLTACVCVCVFINVERKSTFYALI